MRLTALSRRFLRNLGKSGTRGRVGSSAAREGPGGGVPPRAVGRGYVGPPDEGQPGSWLETLAANSAPCSPLGAPLLSTPRARGEPGARSRAVWIILQTEKDN